MPLSNVSESDLFFLSYDEPNAEKHWAELLELAPWADRVHGVKGFDAAHRACALKSTSPWFITVDADCIVKPSFFDLQVELDVESNPRRCYSWNGMNMINGLIYGNGGIKLWSREFVLNMNTHENADDPRKAVDFCWEEDYQQQPQCFSEVWNNGSMLQAFRVGFREGVKLSLDRGERVPAEEMKTRLHDVNLRNLKIWCSVGSDVTNGRWAMYGARLGWCEMMKNAFDHTAVRDYDWFNDLWSSGVLAGKDDLDTALVELASVIERKSAIKVATLDPDASEFFRETFKHRNL